LSQGFEPNEIKATRDVSAMRFGIVVSRFNSFITDRLLAGTLDALERAGASSSQIDVVRVPGSFELPIAAKKMAEAGRYDAVVTTGVSCAARPRTSITSPRRLRAGFSLRRWIRACR
jgi:6,7-dimethyl-8-ribityllumazine synthase